MNQILSVEMKKNNRSENKKLNIKSVIIFFSIMLIVFAISIILIGIYLKSQNSGTVGENKNYLKVEAVLSDTETLKITTSGENEIEKIVYKWNNEEETQVNGNNQKEMVLDISVPIGNNILKLTVTDVKGNSKTYEKTYVGTVKYEPNIQLSQNGNTLNVLCNSDKIIDYISYNFDAEDTITQNVNDTSVEIPIEIKNIEGEHKLSIIVQNQDGEKYTDSKSIYIPAVTVVTDQENFIINASDVRGISKVSINFNDEISEIDVNDTEYTNNLKLQDGENRLILVVYNSDGLSTTKKIRFIK